VVVSAQMYTHKGSAMRAINVQEVQAHFIALVAKVMSSAACQQRGKGLMANFVGGMQPGLRSNGYLN
jgi:hypothetical protein